jgi:hypothetical protein
MSAVRVANAPLSYGAFEMTVGTDRVLDDAGSFGEAAAEQERNRAWLHEHAGW